MQKINVTAVSYLNTKPLLYGIFKSDIAQQIDLQLDIPSVCAEKLRDGRADLGLVPIAVIPEIANAQIVSDFCIGAEGAVKTVSIFSQRPLQELDTIYLDYHSRTSVELVKILLQEYWKLEPKLLPAQAGFENQISGRTGALIIGDRAIGLDQQFTYTYDLAEAWMDHTGLPFVFAAWVSNRPMSPEFIEAFNHALQLGLDYLPQLMLLLPPPHPFFDLNEYYTRYIHYHLDAPKRKAMALFLQKIQVNQHAPLPTGK